MKKITAALLGFLVWGLCAPALALNVRPVPLAGASATPSTAIDFSIHAGAKILETGDSVTAGAVNPGGTPDSTYRWSVEFEQSITTAFTNASATLPTFTNTGVGGNTTTDWLAAESTDIAVGASDIFILIGVNDPFNHGGTAIPPATTQANMAAYIAAMQAKNPGVRIHLMSNMWGSSEHWPTGSNTDDAGIVAVNSAEVTAATGNKFVQIDDIRTPLFTIDEPAQNPSNLASGILIQSGGGYHPTKPLGQTTISWREFARVTLTFR